MKKNKQLNVAFILGGFTKVGGIGRVTSIITNELVKNPQFNITNISFTNRNIDSLYELDERINHLYLFDYHLNMTKAMLKNASGRLRKILISENIDIVVACGAMFYPVSIMATFGTKIKTVCWEHSNLQNTKGYKFQMQARWMASKFSDQIVTLTKHDQNSYIEKYKIQNVGQIYNPVDDNIDKYVRKYNSKTKKIVSVGRLAYQKNFHNLVEVASIVLNKHPNWEWDIYGEGEDYESLVVKIKEFNLTDKLHLKGKVNNLYELYNDYSLLVMTSRFEGFPMTLLEGMAFGLPLISYDILTGPNEIIDNGKNGFLVSHGNTQGIAERINTLIENEDKLIEFSNSNLSKKGNYSLSSIVREWETLFEGMGGADK